MQWSEILKDAIRAEIRKGKTPYRLSKEAGVQQSLFDEFRTGNRENIRLGTGQKLLESLGFSLIRKKTGKQS